jgi:hypothetical protein
LNSNLNSSPISGFSALLYVNFIIKKKYRVDAVAKDMQIATDTLYRYVRGENVMPPDRIIDLVKATGDIELLEFFCEPCGYVPVRAVEGRLSRGEREKEQIRLSILTGQALKEIEDAYEDGKIEKTELRRVERALARIQQKSAELREKLKKEVQA